tara:strand:+ start:158 stop:352 length:195 start_codon:yes stop_codon:yes gene_type:complete
LEKKGVERMRGASAISGIKMNKRLKDQKRKKLWIEEKKKKAAKRRQEIKEAKQKWPNIWRKLKF